ncbi:EF-hand calcium-binding domain-containing protein 2 [Fasciola gigantica]|uniref:EF-hand calcium-binding domain-containing protein 2 n=1 Tax=Fasciola gigantica TaxID=46835 RepID=A0A504YYP0_FASGI|nr:EF-hand calcium-binding domain-containing protein 2 [Fasciola gigantica]
MGEDRPPQISNSELEAKLTEAFDLFDHERNKTIDFRELGTVIRAVGGVPTEAEVLQLVRELENDPPNGYINFEKFLPVLMEAMEQNRFQGASEDDLLEAFSVLDTEKKGFLPASTMETLMSTQGEPFTGDELEEMLAAATDISKGKIVYREYVVLLTSYEDLI